MYKEYCLNFVVHIFAKFNIIILKFNIIIRIIFMKKNKRNLE